MGKFPRELLSTSIHGQASQSRVCLLHSPDLRALKNQRLSLNSNNSRCHPAATETLSSQISRNLPREPTQTPEIQTSKRLLFPSIQLLLASTSSRCSTRFLKANILPTKPVCPRFSNSPLPKLIR
jgi:hypothetical protein